MKVKGKNQSEGSFYCSLARTVNLAEFLGKTTVIYTCVEVKIEFDEKRPDFTPLLAEDNLCKAR